MTNLYVLYRLMNKNFAIEYAEAHQIVKTGVGSNKSSRMNTGAPTISTRIAEVFLPNFMLNMLPSYIQ